MHRLIACFLLLLLFTSFLPEREYSTPLAITRIQYIYRTRQTNGNAVWATFGNDQTSIPLIYYDSNTTFVANPGEKFLRRYNPQRVFNSKQLKVYRVDYRIDNIPLHMEVSMNFGPDTTGYDYNTPYIKCSSREEFETFTRHPTDIHVWAGMVLHECFHGFQFSHAGFTKHAAETYIIYPAIGDSLQLLYKSHGWFQKAVDTENDLLLKAIASTSQYETDSLVRYFFKLREERRQRTKSETNHDIGFLERSFETMEGSARFIEAFITANPIRDKNMKIIDSSFRATIGNYRATYKPHASQYRSEVSQKYFYATGYNQTRLLQKMKKEYATVLFKQPTLTLEDILRP